MRGLRATVGCCKRRSCVLDRQLAIYRNGCAFNIARGGERERQGDMRDLLWLVIASQGCAALCEDGLLVFGKARRDSGIDWSWSWSWSWADAVDGNTFAAKVCCQAARQADDTILRNRIG